jgi:nucleoid DNA-binding protein
VGPAVSCHSLLYGPDPEREITMSRPVRRKEIIRKVAADHGLKPTTVEEAVNSQFSYVKKVMKSDTFDQVRLPFFGRFWVKPSRLKWLQKFGKRVPNGQSDET